MPSRVSRRVIVVLLSGLLLSGAASAERWDRGDGVRSQPSRGQSANKVTSERQAVQLAKRHYPGKVLKVSGSGNGYRVKLLSDSGKVFNVFVDARTGRVTRG